MQGAPVTNVLDRVSFVNTDLEHLPQELKKAHNAGKHILLWDLSGRAALYLDAIEADFMHAMVKVAMCEKARVS